MVSNLGAPVTKIVPKIWSFFFDLHSHEKHTKKVIDKMNNIFTFT